MAATTTTRPRTRRRLHRTRVVTRWAWERRSRERRATLRAARRAHPKTRPVFGFGALAADVGDAGAFVRRKVAERTTMRICIWCSPKQHVPVAEWNQHQTMHNIMGDTRRRKTSQRARTAEAERIRGQQARADARPTNARAGGPAARYAAHARNGTLGDYAGKAHQQSPPTAPSSSGGNDLGLPEWDGTGRPPASWTALGTPPRTTDTTTGAAPGSTGGKAGARWKARTTNPGTSNPPGHVPSVHGPRPGRPGPGPSTPTPSLVKTPPQKETPVAPRTNGSKAGPTGPTGPGGGAIGLGSAAQGWARRLPSELDQSKADTGAMNDELHALADALRLRLNLEVERGMDPSVVEPLEAAARLVSQAGDQVAEVTARQEQKYRELADRLTDRNTPSAAYLSPTNVARGTGT